VTNCHTRWDSVRVYYHIGNDSFSSERQILLSVSHATSTLLTVTTSKLVTNLRDSDGSHLDFSEPKIFLICGNNDLIDDSTLSVL